MRQYRIMYRRAQSAPGQWGILRPHVNAALYDKPEVNEAIELMRTTPHIEGISIRLADEAFNILVVNQEAEATNAFRFVEPPATT